MRAIVIGMFFAIICLTLPHLFHDEYKPGSYKSGGSCACFRCLISKPVNPLLSTDEWQQGEFITLRRIYPHQRCGGQLVFNGKSERAPYSETDRFYDHVCDLCGTTNQILNATWPQYKSEWRAQ